MSKPQKVKAFFISLIRYSGLPFLIRIFIQRKKVTIIYYHNISSFEFDNHLKYLKKKYSIISLQDYINNRSANLKYRLVITFDDGHAANFELLKVLKKHNVQITIFLTSGLINTNRHFWFLSNGLDKMTKAGLKKMGDNERLYQLKEKFGYEDSKEYSEAEALTYSQIIVMKQFVDFQSHSVTHPCLPLCTDEKAENEIKGSKIQLEKLLGTPVNSIAFPNGDYSERELDFSINAGYRSVLTADFGFNSGRQSNFVLKRVSTNDTNNLNELVLRVTGIWKGIKIIKQSIGL